MDMRAMILNKKTLTGAAVILAVVFVFTSFQSWQLSKAVEVKTVAAVRGTLERKVSSTGTVEAIDEQKVYADKPLKVKRLPVREGDTVTAGQILAELDTENLDDLKGQLEQLRASYATAMANLNKITMPGDSRSIKQGEVSLNEVQKAKDTTNNTVQSLTNANSTLDEQIKQAQQNVDLAQRSIEQAKIVASQLDNAYNEAKKDYDRKKTLFDVGGVAQVELDAAKAKMDDQALQKDNQALQVENAKTKYQTAVSAQQTAEYQRKNNDLQLENARLTLASLPLQEEVARLSLDEIRNPLNSTKLAQDAKALQAQAAAYQVQISIMQKKIDTYVTILKAPSAGTVLTTSLKEGETANPNLPAFTIGDPGKLKVVSDAPQKEAYLLKMGLDLTLSGEALGDQKVKGNVSRLFPTVELKKDGGSTDRIIRFEATVQQPTPVLRPGMSVDVDLVTLAKQDVVMVSNSAIRDEEGSKVVYVAQGSKAVRKTVQLGLVNDFDSEVVDGLAPGDKVITSASATVNDGSLVREKPQAK